MRNLLCLLLLSIAISSAVRAQTDEFLILDRRADEFDRWQERVDYTYGTNAISRETNVPMFVLEEQRTRSHFGYGGLAVANILALATGKTFDEIVALKSSGSGWGRIAQDNNVELGSIVGRLDRIEEEFKTAATKNETVATTTTAKQGKGSKSVDKSSQRKDEAATKVKPHRNAKTAKTHGDGKKKPK